MGGKTVVIGFILALLVAVPVLAQGAEGVLIVFSRQGAYGVFDEYEARICNTTDASISFNAGIVKNAAEAEGINAASFSKINRELDLRERMSPLRIAALVAEIAGWGMATAIAADALWKNHSGLQRALPPIIAGGLRFATTATAQASPNTLKSTDLLPLWIEVPAGRGRCVEFTMLANP